MQSCYLFSFVTCDSFIFIYVAVACSFSVLSSVKIPIVWINHSLSILLLIHLGYFSLRPLWKMLLWNFPDYQCGWTHFYLLSILPYEFSVQLFCLFLCLVSCIFLFISRNSLSQTLVLCWLYVFLPVLASWYFYVVKFIWHLFPLCFLCLV